MAIGVTATKKPQKRGRKPATDAQREAWRQVRWTVRLSREEAATIARAARRSGVSESAYLRESGLAAAEARQC